MITTRTVACRPAPVLRTGSGGTNPHAHARHGPGGHGLRLGGPRPCVLHIWKFPGPHGNKKPNPGAGRTAALRVGARGASDQHGACRRRLATEAGALPGLDKNRTTAGGWRPLRGVVAQDCAGCWRCGAQGLMYEYYIRQQGLDIY